VNNYAEVITFYFLLGFVLNTYMIRIGLMFNLQRIKTSQTIINHHPIIQSSKDPFVSALQFTNLPVSAFQLLQQ